MANEPVEQPKTGKGKLTLVAVVGATVALALAQSIPHEESGRKVEASLGEQGELQVRHISGKQYLNVYLDIAGVATACDGIITYLGKPLQKGHKFTEAQCSEMLEEELVKHAVDVMKCSPGLALTTDPVLEDRREGPRFAAVSLAYNVGSRAYCGSTVSRRFNAANYSAGCDALLMWNKARVRGKLVAVRGLTNRRNREHKICMRGL